MLASLGSTKQSQVECGEALTVSGDWVAIPYTAVGAEGGSSNQGIWVLRIHGGGIQWHLAYGTDVADGEEFGPIGDAAVAAEARDFCSILEGSGKVRSASEMMAAMTDEPAVINLPEGLYWSGAAEVEALVPLYPPELEIQCGDDVVASGDWSAHPIVENAPSIGLEQVGMWVYNHRDGKIHRHFAHNTRTAGSGWGLPLDG